MKRRFRAWLAILPAALVACSAPGAPPNSFNETVPASPSGLLALFQRECVEQRNLAWVRRESARRRSQCDRWLSDPGNCEQDMDLGGVSWELPAAANSTVLVTMQWPVGVTPQTPLGPPPGHLTCTLEVPEELGDDLKVAAFTAADGSQPRHGSLEGDEWWFWPPSADGTPQIELYYNGSNGVSRPWSLRYAVFRPSACCDPSAEGEP